MNIENVKYLYEILGKAKDQLLRGEAPYELYRAYSYVKLFVNDSFNKEDEDNGI